MDNQKVIVINLLAKYDIINCNKGKQNCTIINHYIRFRPCNKVYDQ